MEHGTTVPSVRVRHQFPLCMYSADAYISRNIFQYLRGAANYEALLMLHVIKCSMVHLKK